MAETETSTPAPLDKQSRPMRLLVQIDLQQVATEESGLPKQGILRVFISEDIDGCQPKDKSCFKITWQPRTSLPPDAVSAVRVDENTNAGRPLATPLSNCFLLGEDHPRLNEAQAICAFSANGITYSEARAQDDCYSHLMAHTPSWRLLLRLHEKSTDYMVLIQQEDFVEARLDRAWLVRFKGNS